MKKLRKKGIQGLAPIVPILVVAILIVSGFALYSKDKSAPTVSRNVLSESDSRGEDLESSGENENEVENEDDENEAPDLEEVSEPEETTDQMEFEEENEVEVKDGISKSKIKIRSGNNKFEFQQEGATFSVESDFPLSVNPDTNELTVTTPTGSNVVAILPQQAIENMVTSGIVTTTTGVDLKTESDGSLHYTIDGTKKEKLLGVFDVDVSKNLIVSAESGQVLTVNQSTFSKILDFLSI